MARERCIVYVDGDGGVHVVHPAPDLSTPLEYYAQRVVPAGMPYRITYVENLPSDRSQRDLWTAPPSNPNQVSVDPSRKKVPPVVKPYQLYDALSDMGIDPETGFYALLDAKTQRLFSILPVVPRMSKMARDAKAILGFTDAQMDEWYKRAGDITP